jgi:hypothetical protein
LEPSKFASIKLTRKFVEQIKIEAAKARLPMYAFLEKIFQQRHTHGKERADVATISTLAADGMD